jgi:hypothetical protein
LDWLGDVGWSNDNWSNFAEGGEMKDEEMMS